MAVKDQDTEDSNKRIINKKLASNTYLCRLLYNNLIGKKKDTGVIKIPVNAKSEAFHDMV